MNTDRIYLTGYRGTGKTTVGKLISAQLATECVDLDDVIEQAAGKSIREIFAEGGEELFRNWESRCLGQVAADQARGRVISLGGGAILRDQNRQVIRQTGVCIWLTAGADVIADRLSTDQTTGQRRPALTDLSAVEEIRELLARREPLYRQSADFVLETDQKSPEQLAAEVVAWLSE
ncbi:Shikimate kinase 2 [Stieleria maiorica]|uniref:Shikimate kinase n=1 Tax=Stieleria maiorica TaxID=2795974 RepID=A0A5B9MMC9_9BACT|nr:shikimate kinase [Stieleria maiorica]QEG00666.1 Shikimate kinase 2 [Stieleria maiorica]